MSVMSWSVLCVDVLLSFFFSAFFAFLGSIFILMSGCVGMVGQSVKLWCHLLGVTHHPSAQSGSWVDFGELGLLFFPPYLVRSVVFEFFSPSVHFLLNLVAAHRWQQSTSTVTPVTSEWIMFLLWEMTLILVNFRLHLPLAPRPRPR